MAEKLTRKQVIRALRRLERGWPDDLQLIVGDDTVTLYPYSQDGEFDGERVPMTESGSFDQEASIARFPGINCDAGGY